VIPSERLKGIEAFVVSADSGSFTAAAARLNLTNSAVSKGVARLEARLGSRLFDRTTRRLALTDAGAAFYATCVRVLADLEDAAAVLAAHRSEAVGRVRINVPVAFGRMRVMPLLLDFAERNTGLRPQVSFSDRFVDLIEDGVDVAVRISGSNQWAVGLGRRYLGTERLIFCAAPRYIERHGLPRCADELARQDCVLYGKGDGSTITWRFGSDGGTIEERMMEGRLILGSAEAQVGAVKAGFGVAQLATWLIEDELLSGELIELLPERSTRGLAASSGVAAQPSAHPDRGCAARHSAGRPPDRVSGEAPGSMAFCCNGTARHTSSIRLAGKIASGGIMKDDSQGVPAAGAHLADAVPQRHPVIAPGAAVRPLVDGEHHAVALGKRHDGRACLHARTLLGKHELAALERRLRLGQQCRDLQGEDMLAVEILVQAIIIARTILQQQRRRSALPGGVAPRQERRMSGRKPHVHPHALMPGVRDRSELRIERRSQCLHEIGQWIGKIAVFPPSETVSRHDDVAAERGVVAVQAGNGVALIRRQQFGQHCPALPVERAGDRRPVEIRDAHRGHPAFSMARSLRLRSTPQA
jgi:DNA-binding transcriptional LysR family regulator